MEISTSQPGWFSAAKIVLQILVPLILVLTSVRLLMTDSFVRFNYALPGFPPDLYGFTSEDRQLHAPIALAYLLNDAGIDFLGDQQFEDGTPVYNARELRHMVDVKNVTRTALTVWQISILSALAIGALIWRFSSSLDLLETLQGGAKLTAIIMGILIVGLIVGFSVLFVGFHQVFFDPDTWTFSFSDTLIRLFPERFWQVAFATVGVATLIQAGVIYLIARLLLSRTT